MGDNSAPDEGPVASRGEPSGRQVSDDALGALSNPHTRYALRYLREHRRATVDEVVDAVAGAEAAATGAVTGSERRAEVRLSLHHVVLPKLDALGYVAFDSGDGTVERTGVPSAVYDILDVLGEHAHSDADAR
jgi:hypothetical protein